MEPFETLLEELARDRRSERRWRTLKRVAMAGAVAGYLLFQANLLGWIPAVKSPTAGPHVAVVELEGPVSASSPFSADLVVPLLKRTCEDARTAGVVLRINSPGGSPDEADRIGRAVDACRAGGKKVVSFIDGLGASAAYLVAVHAQEVHAGRFSLVGSIGAIIQSLDAEDALSRLGVRSRVYASGSQKSAGSLWRHDTAEQARTLQSLADAAGQQFAAEVEKRRGNRLRATPDRNSGRVWTAADAKALGLVDGVMVYEDLLASAFPGIPAERVVPRRPLSEAFSMSALVQAVKTELTGWSAEYVP